MFISTALAQTAGTPAAGGEAIMSFLPLILIFVIFYFLLIRPQQKRAKEHKDMLMAVRRGDKIVTGGGIVATVVRVGPAEEPEILVEIAENVRVKIMRTTVANVLSRTEPVKTETTAAASAAEGGKAPGLLNGLLGKLLGKK